jgi:hypothetical protein
MKRDLVIGIVGAAILVAAMVGVFRYEAARAGSAYDVEWTTTTLDGPVQAGETAEGQRSEVTLAISEANLTALTFVLTWTDDVGAGDEFQLTVVDPAGEVSQSARSTTGEIALTFEGLATAPPASRVVATSESDARAQLARQHTITTGTGTWSVIVELLNADETSTVVGNVPVPPDTGNAWTLQARQVVYEPTLSAV